MSAPARHRSTPLAVAASLVVAVGMAACSVAVSSTSEQQPLGPSPAVTVIVRLGADASSVDLLGSGTDPVELQQATSAIAGQVVDPSEVGTVVPGVSNVSTDAAPDHPLLTTTVPITVSDQAFTIDLSSEAIGQALEPIRPKSTDVWVCTDRSRTVQMNSQAPGAVSTDIASGTCQSAGSSLYRDGVTWTASAAIGPVTSPSILPWLLGGLAVLIGAAALVLLVRRRRLATAAVTTAPPVH
jgi:hypothetical protein